MSLPPSIQHLLADGRLSAGHARALLGTPDRAFQEQLARRASTEGWSVRAVEEAVRDRASGFSPLADDGSEAADGSAPSAPAPAGTKRTSRLRPPGLLELEDLLAERLSTKVNVSMGTKRGKLVIEFADLEDLERLYHLMNGGDSGHSTTVSD